MAKTMRAGVVRAFGKPLSIEDIPVPTPGPGEVLIKVVASGVCHTDLHAAEGDWPAKPSLPFVPGRSAPSSAVPRANAQRRRSHQLSRDAEGAVVCTSGLSSGGRAIERDR